MIALSRNPYEQNPIAALGTVPEWWVDLTNGDDSWNGQDETNTPGTTIGPFKTIEKLCETLFPNGQISTLLTIALVHVAPGAYGKLRVNPDNQTDHAFFLWFVCEFTEGADITLSAVTNTDPATRTRGEIETLAGTFVNKKRIRIKSGSNPDAVAWSAGLNGGDPKKTFVSSWTDGSVTTVDASIGDVVGVDDLTVSFDEVDLEIHGFGGIIVQDASMPNGGVCHSTNFLDSIQLYRCDIAGTWTGAASIFASRVNAGAEFSNGFFRFAGNAYQANVTIDNNCFALIEGAHLSDGATWFWAQFAQGLTIPGSGEPANTAWEFENGAGHTAINVQAGCMFNIQMRLWSAVGGGTGAYALGVKVGSAVNVAYSILPTIAATIESNIGGTNKAFSTWPFADAAHASATVLIT